MIERKFINQNLKRFHITQFLYEKLTRAGVSEVELQRTPLGDKIVIHSSRPGLVVGKGGSNIKQLTKDLEAEFDLDDPQIEIEEIEDPRDDATIMAEMISNNLERYGASRFKGIGHKTLNSAMRAGALGAEIIITGKVPGSRARRWRFYDGYLKKCGETAVTQVETDYRRANLNSGAVGIKVSVMKGDAELPDKLKVKEPQVEEMPVDDSESDGSDQDTDKTAEDQTEDSSDDGGDDENEGNAADDTKPSKSEDSQDETEESDDDKQEPSSKDEETADEADDAQNSGEEPRENDDETQDVSDENGSEETTDDDTDQEDEDQS